MYIPLIVGAAGVIILSSIIGGRYSNNVNIVASIIIIASYYL